MTKLVATIGPSSEEYEPLSAIVAAGMNVMRLNFSHATKEEFFLRKKNLAKAPGGEYVCTMLDTRGPEIRTGGLKVCKETGNRKAKITLEEGKELILTTDATIDGQGDETVMYVNYMKLTAKVKKGTKILLDDGAVVCEVQEVPSKTTVVTKIMNSGKLGERKGVNLPGIPLELPAMSEKDKADILFGIEEGIDCVAASFVHDAAGVNKIREYIQECATKLKIDEDIIRPSLFAKIESVEAMSNLEEIIDASDGIMVARGDLGVEVPLVQVCQYQKDIIAACRARGKPVIVATQMLDSMSSSPTPTRAEVADCTNAVIDGADALMLSGESANGEYPIKAVETQRQICETTEAWLRASMDGPGAWAPTETPTPAKHTPEDSHGLSKAEIDYIEKNDAKEEAISISAIQAARASHADAIVAMDNDAYYQIDPDEGRLARRLSAYYPDLPVLTLVSDYKNARQLNLFRAIVPYVYAELRTVNEKDGDTMDIISPFDAAKLARDVLGLPPTATIVAVVQSTISVHPGEAPFN